MIRFDSSEYAAVAEAAEDANLAVAAYIATTIDSAITDHAVHRSR